MRQVDTNFLNSRKKYKKVMTPGVLNSEEIKIDSNSKMLNFNMVFTSY